MGVHIITEWRSDADGNLYKRESMGSASLGKWTMNSHEGTYQRVTKMTPDEMKEEISEMSSKLDSIAEYPNTKVEDDVSTLIQVLAMLTNLVREMIDQSTLGDDKKQRSTED